MSYLKIYLLSAVSFFMLDMLWLGWLARSFYRRQIGSWMAEQTDWLAAGIFYLLFLGGLIYFATLPAISSGTGTQALLRGAAFGLVTYATYELTNKAVIANWPLPVVIVDILWGMVLCAVVTWVGWALGKTWLG